MNNPYKPETQRPEPPSRNWQTQAACRDADPEDFFPKYVGKARARRLAQQYCHHCPVIVQCAQLAATPDPNGTPYGHHGIWAGRIPTPVAQRRRQTDVSREAVDLLVAGHMHGSEATEAERTQAILELRTAGYSAEGAARRIHITPEAARRISIRLGFVNDGAGHITDQERAARDEAVTRLNARGVGDVEIGRQLGLPSKTVWHVRQRLGLPGIGQARRTVNRAFRNGGAVRTATHDEDGRIDLMGSGSGEPRGIALPTEHGGAA